MRRGTGAAPRPRWMTLRYAGTCNVCGIAVPSGAVAYWHGRAGITCSSLDCAAARGLTRDEWVGSPVSGGYVTVRAAAPARTWKQTYGRCEDAPCCGCCD